MPEDQIAELVVRTLICRQPGCFNRDMPVTMPCADVVVCCCGTVITETYPAQ